MPEKVARVGLAALASGKTSVISGFKNWLGAETVRMVPRRTVARVAASIFRPKENQA
jgi:short-subunit dehydrogenase